MHSRITYLICAILLACSGFFFYPRWQQHGTNAAIAWDVSGYYWYLPSVFIYHDLKHQSFRDSILKKYEPTPNMDFQQGTPVDNGNYVMKYSSGMAFMYLPFFTAAHLLAKPLGFPADGFSLPYQFAIQLGGFLVSLLGLWYLRKLLRLFYDDTVTAITMLLLVFGTNYLNYAGIDTGMSHPWLFTVYVFLLLNTHFFYQAGKTKYAVRIGLLVGLATLTRPTDIIAVFIPLLWGIERISAESFRQRLAFFLKEKKKIMIAAACSAAIIFIQPLYWKYASGHWLIYSYGDQKFSWLHPHIIDYNFDYSTGWLRLTPMMFFAFTGLIPFWMYGKNRLAITTFFLVNWYIVSSWDVWQYGGRAMIQSYPILLFPIASLVAVTFQKKVLRWGLYPIFILFLYLNIWLTYHQHAGNIDLYGMSEAYFWKVLGKWNGKEEWLKLRDTNELFEGTPSGKTLLYQDGFESDTAYSPLPAIAGRHSLYADKDHPAPAPAAFLYRDASKRWLRAQATFHCPGKEWDFWRMQQLRVSFTNKGQEVKSNMIRISPHLQDGETKDLFIDVRVPATAFDSVKVSLSTQGDQPVQMDNLQVWSFNG